MPPGLDTESFPKSDPDTSLLRHPVGYTCLPVDVVESHFAVFPAGHEQCRRSLGQSNKMRLRVGQVVASNKVSRQHQLV